MVLLSYFREGPKRPSHQVGGLAHHIYFPSQLEISSSQLTVSHFSQGFVNHQPSHQVWKLGSGSGLRVPWLLQYHPEDDRFPVTN